MRGWPRFSDFPQDGRLWMLAWLGPLFDDHADTGEHALYGYLVPVTRSKKRSPAQINKGYFPQNRQFDPSALRRVTLDASHLTALSIGMMFRDGKLVMSRKPLLWRASFQLDTTRQQAQRLSESNLLTPEQLLLEQAADTLSHAAYLALPDDQGRTIIIPALEVLRWLYGSSSRVLQDVFSGAIVGTVAEVQSHASWQGTHYHMPLPAGFLPTDAALLAALATQNAALQAAQQVHLSISAGGKDRTFFPKATVPVTGWQRASVLGRYLDRERKTFLAHRILVWPQRLPFQSIRLPDQIEHVSDGTLTEPLQETRTQTHRARVNNASRLTLEARTAPSNRTPLRLPALPAQFSDFSAISRDHRQETAQSGAVPLQTKFISPGKTFSASPVTQPGSHTKQGVLGADMQSDESPVYADYFTKLREAVDLLKHRYTFTEHPINAPGATEGRFQGWYKSDKQRVACLVIEAERISKPQQFFYLLEKERIGGSFGPLILAQKADGKQATESELAALMQTRVGQTTWPKQVSGWRLRQVRHIYKEEAAYADALRRFMEAMIS